MVKLKLIGKKDKNNKEISIGDLVEFRSYKNENKQIAKVCWDDSICACTLLQDTFVVDTRSVIEILFIHSNEMLEVVNNGE